MSFTCQMGVNSNAAIVEPTAVLAIPQLVVIDRSGTIRAATGRTDPKLEDESSFRALIEDLLRERAADGK